MAAFLVVDTAIENAEEYEKYKALAKPIAEKFGGRYRVRGGELDVLEADLSQWLGRASAKTMRDDEILNDGMRRVVRQTAQDEIGKKPEVTVVVSRLS